MSKSVNRVTLLGNIGADPEVRSTSGGGRVATFSVATSRRWKNDKGEPQEKTQWHRVVAWNNARGQSLADLVEKYCKKGDRIMVEGEIEYRTWDDKEGTTRYSTEIVAFDIVLLEGAGKSAARETDPHAPLDGRR